MLAVNKKIEDCMKALNLEKLEIVKECTDIFQSGMESSLDIFGGILEERFSAIEIKVGIQNEPSADNT